MAKKIRFPLEMADGTQVRTLDELKEHFDLGSVLEFYKNGRLLTWLQDRYLETEADAVQSLDEGASGFQASLCKIFGVEHNGETIDVEEIERRQERLKRLRTYTDEKEFIDHIDQVAFDQEELADLLDDEQKEIYLCGDKFNIPISQHGVRYIGINSPTVHISGKVPDNSSIDDLGISFESCSIDNLPVMSSTTPNTTDFTSHEDDPFVSLAVADRCVKHEHFLTRTERGFYFHNANAWGYFGPSELYYIDIRTEEEKCIKVKCDSELDVKTISTYANGNKLYFLLSTPILKFFGPQVSNIYTWDIEKMEISKFLDNYEIPQRFKPGSFTNFLVLFNDNNRKYYFVDIQAGDAVFEISAPFNIRTAIACGNRILLEEYDCVDDESEVNEKVTLHWYDPSTNSTELAIKDASPFVEYPSWEKHPDIFWIKPIKNDLLILFVGENAYSLCRLECNQKGCKFTVLDEIYNEKIGSPFTNRFQRVMKMIPFDEDDGDYTYEAVAILDEDTFQWITIPNSSANSYELYGDFLYKIASGEIYRTSLNSNYLWEKVQ